MRSGERVFVGVFGAFLLGIGIYVLLFGAGSDVWRYGGGIALAAIGANAVYGALTGTRPWMSRVGPLP